MTILIQQCYIKGDNMVGHTRSPEGLPECGGTQCHVVTFEIYSHIRRECLDYGREQDREIY